MISLRELAEQRICGVQLTTKSAIIINLVVPTNWLVILVVIELIRN